MRVSPAERASSLGQAIRVLGIAFERLNILQISKFLSACLISLDVLLSSRLPPEPLRQVRSLNMEATTENADVKVSRCSDRVQNNRCSAHNVTQLEVKRDKQMLC